MDKLTTHKDVLETVYKYQLEQLLEKQSSNEELDTNEVLFCLNNGFLLKSLKYTELTEQYNASQEKIMEYAKMIIRINKENKEEHRILNLFLSNHDLLDEYELFDMRIMRDKYERKEKMCNED
jgi:hypothetical protein